MIDTHEDAITAAARFVASDDQAWNAAYRENRETVRAQGGTEYGARQALRDAVRGGHDQYGAKKLAATWLAGNVEHLERAVAQGVRNGELGRGVTVGDAQRFLNEALGVHNAGYQRVQEQPAEPVRALREEFVNALDGQTGTIKITVETDADALRELLRDVLGL